jgi:hypothetical protein
LGKNLKQKQKSTFIPKLGLIGQENWEAAQRARDIDKVLAVGSVKVAGRFDVRARRYD